ncbi:ATP-binding protein [Candidatus Woesearchaeota archaeon]|nr:ATP-binding protein [Candidatus Woesearchaeota archaeon]
MITTNFEKIFLNTPDPFPSILGQEVTKRHIKSALLMQRHIILIGPPGIGKTTLARNIAKSLPDLEVEEEIHGKKTKKVIKGEERFIRIQGSPDLTVEDLLGDIDPEKALKYGALSVEAFTPGKIFKANKGILFFDEVNRCPEKLQNALLQVLEEGRATLGSFTVDFPTNFIFIGTMNPEDSSTEKLSSVFLDRFDVIPMSYPESAELEKKIVLLKGKKLAVDMHDKLVTAAVVFIRLLREHKDVEQKPSVRASLGLYERAQANAFLAKRRQVTFQDLQDAVLTVVPHRLELKPSVKYLQSREQFVQNQLKLFAEEQGEEEDDVP